ncbi:F-box only protein 36 [Spea bombifrons]|uniref:F-box only protein 36 n=1 Tax=Spea bombifrons TaxID=233779 RepID=UPI00234AD341|nr:F-box only protein 36 [Spea bombifrons]
MATLLPEVLLETTAQAPAPNKDFYQLLLTRNEVILRWWKISLRSEFRNTKPGELKESHVDFVDDTTLQAQIGIVFGQNTLNYVLKLCQGYYDFLDRLPDSLLLYILTFLDLEDIAQLAQVSHSFQKICNSDKLWEHIVERSCDRVTVDMRALAQDIGWKQLFFTNKLQLQLQLRRWKRRQEESRDVC